MKNENQGRLKVRAHEGIDLRGSQRSLTIRTLVITMSIYGRVTTVCEHVVLSQDLKARSLIRLYPHATHQNTEGQKASACSYDKI